MNIYGHKVEFYLYKSKKKYMQYVLAFMQWSASIYLILGKNSVKLNFFHFTNFLSLFELFFKCQALCAEKSDMTTILLHYF